MDGPNRFDQFDLGRHGDRHEQEFWPLLCGRFPTYEILWRRLIVPLTCRIDPRVADSPEVWIRLRSGIPVKYEQMSMAHYSVFYHLGRALKRLSEDPEVFEYPEDVFVLLDSVGDNLRHFMEDMNSIGEDCGVRVFNAGDIEQFPKGVDPFQEISAYRDVLLHNPVLGRGVRGGETYLPKWSSNRSASPLELGKISWREAKKLSGDALISTRVLLDRLVTEVCACLETYWVRAIAATGQPSFQAKMMKVIGIKKCLPLKAYGRHMDYVQPASGHFSSAGSNTNFIVPSDPKRSSNT